MLTIEELRAQLRAMEEAARNEGRAEYEALCASATFEWKLELEPFGFHVTCRYDEQSRAAFKAWRAAYPAAQVTIKRDPDEWHGMRYTLGYTRDGTPFIESHGGSVILDFGRRSSFGPHKIDRHIAEQIEAGIIPDSIMKPW